MTTMVAKKRDEILRLLQKVRAGSEVSAGQPQTAKETRQRAVQYRRDISQLKRKRSDLERELVQKGFYELYRQLEERLEALEAALRPRSCTPPGDAADQAPIAGGLADLRAAADSAPADYTLGGMIKEGILADILQLITSNMMSGQFSVSSDHQLISLYFDEGQICHADGAGLSGESAFFGAMALEEGRFYFYEGVALPEQRTIESQTQFLILEGLRQIDEARARGD